MTGPQGEGAVTDPSLLRKMKLLFTFGILTKSHSQNPQHVKMYTRKALTATISGFSPDPQELSEVFM